MSLARSLRRIALAAGIVVAPALLAGGARAGMLVDQATEAEKLIADGRPIEALATVESAFNEVWRQAPLSFSEALFVAERPAGFGIYSMRPSTVFRPGQDMLVYAEPFGYGYGRDGELFDIGFSADFELRTARGQILHSQKGFADLAMKSRRQNKEFQVFITYNFQGLKPGDYVLVTRLSDKHTDKVGSFDLPFTVAAPQP